MRLLKLLSEKIPSTKARWSWRKSIFLRTTIYSWILIVSTLVIFAMAVIPYQKDLLVSEMESKAQAIGTSIAQVTAASIVLEDYSSVVDHCMKILKERPSILYLVVARKDGFSLVNTAENWSMITKGKEWIPTPEKSREGEFIQSRLAEEQVFHYSYPFSYSGIDWGWIHVGLSTRQFYSELNTIYLRTFCLFLLFILGSLGLSLLFARQLSLPILHLNRITQRVGAGDLSAKAEINSGDEVEKLADSLNQMTQNLQSSRQELIAGRDYTRNIIKSMGESLIVLEPNMKIRQVNQAACELLGYDEGELIGRPAHKVFVDGDFKERGMVKIIKTGRVTDLETSFKTRSGQSVPVLFSSRAMRDKQGELEAIVVIARDITDRKNAEDELERRARIESMLADISARLIDCSEVDSCIDVSLGRIAKLINVHRTSLFIFKDVRRKMNNTHEWCAPEVTPRKAKLQNLATCDFPWWMSQLQKGENIVISDHFKLPREVKTEVEHLGMKDTRAFLVVPLYFGGELGGFLGFEDLKEVREWKKIDIGMLRTAADIIGSGLGVRRAEKALKVGEERYRSLINNMPDSVFAIDLEGNFSFASPRLLSLTGYPLEKLLRMNIFQLVAPEYHDKVKERINCRIKRNKGEEFPPYELEIIKAEGNRVFVQILTSASFDPKGEVIGVQGIARDITQQKNLERQLFHSQKMDAIGKLAGGIAHDFNNLLAAILGNLELAKLDIDPDHPASESMDSMQEAGLRATELVKQLLQFGRPNRTDEKIISLNEMIEEAIGFLRAVIPTTIKFEREFSPEPCRIKADPSVITQIITNLSVNARDAMPEGGRLRFLTRSITVDELYCKTNLDAAPGEYCLLEISDSGTGIPEPIKERIFEPFFTTKEQSMGTGLGLSMVYGAVKQMGGWIQLNSEQGMGTEFKIFIPKTRDETASRDEKTVQKTRGGDETILLADDEELVLNVGRKILERYGYRVLTAKDGMEAVSLFNRKKDDIALAILDLTMPGGGGLTAMEEIHKVSRNFPVIISSGYSSDQVWKKAKQRARAFLPKPFPPIKMAGMVRQVLDSSG